MLLYPRASANCKSLLGYGVVLPSQQDGQLAGNHFITYHLAASTTILAEARQMVFGGKGAQPIRMRPA